MQRSQVLRCVCVWLLLCVCCRAFELQDTIHALIEENIHLHDKLENLTRALRELRQLLFHHSDEEMRSYDDAFNLDQHHDHDEELQHLWDEWSQHSITPETHLLLEHALCGHDLHGFASSISEHMKLLCLLTFIMLTHILL